MDMSIQLCLGISDAVADPADSGAGDGTLGIALRDFLASNYARLHRRLLRHLGCSGQASDCLHDAWLRLGDMTIPVTVQNQEAYVFRVACNVAMDHLRSNRPRQYAGDPDTELEQFPDHAPGPERIAEARSELDAVERAMRRLPRRQLAILVALRVDELTRDEVANRYGLSLRSVDTTLRRAVNYCAKQADQPVAGGARAHRLSGR